MSLHTPARSFTCWATEIYSLQVDVELFLVRTKMLIRFSTVAWRRGDTFLPARLASWGRPLDGKPSGGMVELGSRTVMGGGAPCVWGRDWTKPVVSSIAWPCLREETRGRQADITVCLMHWSDGCVGQVCRGFHEDSSWMVSFCGVALRNHRRRFLRYCASGGSLVELRYSSHFAILLWVYDEAFP